MDLFSALLTVFIWVAALAGLYLMFQAMALVHEIGHAVVARLCGWDVTGISLGLCPFERTVRLGNFSLWLDRDASATTRTYPARRPFTRGRGAAVLAGGGFANLVVGLACIWAGEASGSPLLNPLGGIVLVGAFNLLPISGRSDGARLLELAAGSTTWAAQLAADHAADTAEEAYLSCEPTRLAEALSLVDRANPLAPEIDRYRILLRIRLGDLAGAQDQAVRLMQRCIHDPTYCAERLNEISYWTVLDGGSGAHVLSLWLAREAARLRPDRADITASFSPWVPRRR